MGDVIHILGCGPAGLAAAVKLIEYDIPVSLIEKNRYLGGRTRSFVDRDTGDEIDNGQHLLMSNYKYTNKLLKKLGVFANVEYQKNFNTSFMIGYYKDRWIKKKLSLNSFPYPFHFVPLFTGNFFSAKEKIDLLKMFFLKWVTPSRYRNVSSYQLLKKYGQSEGVILKFWEPFVVSVFNSSLSQTDASLLVSLLQKTIFKSGRSMRLGFPVTSLNNILANPAEKYLTEHGVIIHRSTLIDKIEFNGQGNVTGLKDNEGRVIPVQYLIAAVPQDQLVKLLPINVKDKLWKEGAVNFDYNPILSVYVWTSSPIFHDVFWGVTGCHIQWIFNKRVFGGPFASKYFLYQITISDAEQLVNEPVFYIEKIIIKELNMVFPDFNINTIAKIKIIKEKKATPVASLNNENNRLPLNAWGSNLFFAGDWTKTGLPYTIEGAVQSGMHAANNVIDKIFFKS